MRHDSCPSLLGVSLSEFDLRRVMRCLGLNVKFKLKEIEVLIFREVINIIKHLNLNEKVKHDAKLIFRILVRAEEEVHRKDYRYTVFHEVGSDDTIFDVVCSTIGLNRLTDMGYTFFANPIRLGNGFIEFSHGKYPVPTPATVNILKGSNLEVMFGCEGELFTPTAAAILAYYCKKQFHLPFKGRRHLLRGWKQSI
jgi:hypothetical protein